MYRASCTVYYADQQIHKIYIYIHINNFLYIVSTTTCFIAPALSSGSLNLVLAKGTKLFNLL